jgi:hypothetical protein
VRSQETPATPTAARTRAPHSTQASIQITVKAATISPSRDSEHTMRYMRADRASCWSQISSLPRVGFSGLIGDDPLRSRDGKQR